MRKFSTVLIGAASVAALFAITACKELFANIEEDFSYWASEPVITGFTAAASAQTSPAGVQCVPSATDAVITLTVRNPKNFSFVMPGTGAPADIVRFASGIHDASGTKAPEAGTDYTLSQSGQSTLTLTYKPAFLKRYEQSRANIGASITLYSTDGRKFNQTYSFDLEANTPPPDPAPVEASAANKIALFKTCTPEGGKHYYVLCFKVDGLPGENVPANVPLHSDLTHVYVSKNGGTETAYPVTLTTGHTDFDNTHSGGTFIAKTDAAPLSNAEADALSGSPQPDTVPSGPWVLYLKTDVPVGGVTAKYGIRLFDGKFYSARAEQTIGKRELPAPKVFADSTMNNTAGSGVYTEKGATDASGNNDLNGGGATIGGVLPDGSDETRAIPVYSAYGNAVKLTIKKPDGTDYPAGVTVTGSAEKHSGYSVPGSASFTAGQSAVVTLPSPADGGGVAVYKVVFKATGEGFDDSTTRTLYYKVRREVKAVSGLNQQMWHILKKAIAYTSADGTVVVNGEIKATNASGNYDEITIDKNLTIRGNNKTSDILNANTTDGSKPGHRIFSVNFGTLTLKNLTLKGGICSSGAGGGIYISDNSSSCKMADTDIKNCTVSGGNKLGGAVYVRINGSLTVESGCVISGNTAPDGKGAAVYLESGGTFNIAGDAQINEANDVFLEKNADVPYVPSKNAKLTVTAPLTGTHIVARITPDDYTAGIAAVNASGVDISGYANRFKITDQNPTTSWKLIHNGTDLVLKQVTTVIPSGSNAWKTLKNAIEASTVEDGDEFVIQGAITATSATGDHGAISVTKKITVKGAGSTPTLDADTRSRIFTVENGGELTLENLTLKKGKADGTQDADKYGGGILVKEGCKAKLKNCTVKKCQAEENGGAIYSEGELTLEDSIIGGASASDGNKAKQGGGIFLTGSDAACTMTGGKISYNEARRTDGERPDGGGIYIEQSASFTMKGGEISNNKSENSNGTPAYGGGVYVNGQTGGTSVSFTLENGTIKNNTAYFGGGVVLNNGGIFNMKGGTIEGNHATNEGGGVGVQGIMKMTGGTISGNTASGHGKGVYVSTHKRVMEMSGSAKIDINNDVYLNGSASNNAKVTVDGTLSNNPAARITPQSYTENTSVLTGAVGSNYTKFTVTPDVKEDGIAQAWIINVAGKLKKSNMEVRYDKLNHYLTASSHAVVVNGIYRFKITGTIQSNHLQSAGYNQMGILAQTIHNSNKKVALILPDNIPGLTSMKGGFDGCEYLVSLENIPSGVTDMEGCFKGCTRLTHAPAIPSGPTTMRECFKGCTALSQASNIPSTVRNMNKCFEGCTNLTGAPQIESGVTDIESSFSGCIALTQGPDIPSSVTNIQTCFDGCTKLQKVKINCNYNNLFANQAFRNCGNLKNGGIKVPPGQLTPYQNNAGNMGTTANKFSEF